MSSPKREKLLYRFIIAVRPGSSHRVEGPGGTLVITGRVSVSWEGTSCVKEKGGDGVGNREGRKS